MKWVFQISAVALLFFGSAAANAESRAERQACESDAFRVCSAEIPDRHNVFLCLMANSRQLSPACRAVMAQYSRPNSRHDETAGHRAGTTTGEGGYDR